MSKATILDGGRRPDGPAGDHPRPACPVRRPTTGSSRRHPGARPSPCSPSSPCATAPVALIATDQRMPRHDRHRACSRQAARPRPTPSCCCSPPTPTPTSRSRRSTTSGSTTTCSSRGTRPAERLYPVVDDLLGDWQQAHPAGDRRRAGGRPPLVGAQPRDQDVPGPQPRALPLARRRPRRRGQRLQDLADAADDDLPLVLVPDREPLRSPSTRRPRRTRSACAPAPSSRSTTCASSAAARPAWPRPSTRHRRACARWSSSARRPVARPARARRSRTTWASPRGSPAPTSPTGPSPRRRRFGAEMVLARDVVGAREARPGARGLLRRRRRDRGARAARGHRRLLPPPRGAGARRAHRSRASTTARRPARPRSAPGDDVLRRRRRQLGRSGGAQLRQVRQPGASCSCAAPRSRTACRSTSWRGSGPLPTSRSGCAARSRRPAATGHLESVTLSDRDDRRHGGGRRPTGCSSSSAPPRAPTGWAATSSATTRASSSPDRTC